MSTIDVHTCPRCELRFDRLVELNDHLRRDHDHTEEPLPAPDGRVVLAVDPSRPEPTTAVTVAAALAIQLGAALDVVAGTPPGLQGITTDAFLQARVREGRHLGVPWVSWHDLGAGDPAAAVVAHAADVADTWLCLASRARSAIGEKIFGSVTAEVLRTAKVPVVVIGPETIAIDEPYSRVIAGVDRSPAAPAVVAAAAALAERLDARLVLVEVSAPTLAGDPVEDEQHLQELAAGLDQPADTMLLAGYRPWQEILDVVDGDPTTVIVTGRRPADAPGHFVAGSVATNLARRARGPVMVVPKPNAEARPT